MRSLHHDLCRATAVEKPVGEIVLGILDHFEYGFIEVVDVDAIVHAEIYGLALKNKFFDIAESSRTLRALQQMQEMLFRQHAIGLYNSGAVLGFPIIE